MRFLILIAAIAMSGCDVPAGTAIDSFIPIPHPPKSSSMRETMRFSVPNPPDHRVMTSDGIFYTQADGVYRVDYTGKKTLFVAWAQISPIEASWDTNIYRLSDDSLLLSTKGRTEYGSSTNDFYFQHISRSGQPLELIRTSLDTGSYIQEVQSIDASHALVYGLRGILDFKKRTYVPISQENGLTESGFEIVGTHIVTTDRGAMPDCACRASILVYNLDGKLAAKQTLDKLAPVQGISQYSAAHFASRVLQVSPHLAGAWIWREPDRYSGSHDTGSSGYYFFAFDLDQLRNTQGMQLGYAQEIPRLNYFYESFDMTWLGGLNFAWPAKSEKTGKDGLKFTTISNNQLVLNDFVFKDWEVEYSETSRTDDGSLSLFEYSRSQKTSRIQLINPDGRVRLSEVLPLGDPSSWKDHAKHTILGSHIMIEAGDQNIVYEIIDSPEKETSL